MNIRIIFVYKRFPFLLTHSSPLSLIILLINKANKKEEEEDFNIVDINIIFLLPNDPMQLS